MNIQEALQHDESTKAELFGPIVPISPEDSAALSENGWEVTLKNDEKLQPSNFNEGDQITVLLFKNHEEIAYKKGNAKNENHQDSINHKLRAVLLYRLKDGKWEAEGRENVWIQFQ